VRFARHPDVEMSWEGDLVPRVRLSHDEASSVDLTVAGNLQKLLRKLKCSRTRTQVERGTACLRCKTRKRKCDGNRPCSTCVSAKVPCDQDSDVSGNNLSELSSVLPLVTKVDRPVSAPDGYVHPHMDPAKCRLSSPLEVSNMMRIGFDYGLQTETLHRMFLNMPDKLLRVLETLLAQVLKGASSRQSKLPPLPDSVDLFHDTATVGRCVARNLEFGVQAFASYNQGWVLLSGAHSEEVNARVAQKDMPAPMSEYRLLASRLHIMHTWMQDPHSVSYRMIPMRRRHVQQNLGEQWGLVRVGFKQYRNGGVVTFVNIQPEEYDRAVQLAPLMKGRFVECDLSGQELVEQHDMMERESLANMVRTPEGRAKLDRLADLVVREFNLPSAPPSPLDTYLRPFPTCTPSPLPSPSSDDSCSPPPRSR